MTFRPHKLNRRVTGLFLLLIFILIACASPAAQTPAAVTSTVIPTLTPFQPQATVQDLTENLTIVPQLPPLSEPTFTPYPTRYVPSDEFPTPAAIIPGTLGAPTDYSNLVTYNPLTGLPVDNPALLERRPMVIKVGNSPDYVRPQSGLSLADVVYEYYIEWGDTRFIAVMYGNDSPHVGPVRSGRYFDEHIAHMYDAFLVFKYADPREYTYLKASDIQDFLVVPGFGACPPFVSGGYKRDSYNNYFFDTTQWAKCALKKGVDNSRPNLSGGFFSEDVAPSDLLVDRIYSYYSGYSYNYWQYDPLFHKYFRYQEANDIGNGKTEAYTALTDVETGQPVTADNVVMLFVPYTFANENEAEDEVYHIDLIDFGNAYVFRDGVAYPALWRRTDVHQPILLTTLLGTPIYLHPGRTFYEVMGVTSSYTQSGTNWKFTFATP